MFLMMQILGRTMNLLTLYSCLNEFILATVLAVFTGNTWQKYTRWSVDLRFPLTLNVTLMRENVVTCSQCARSLWKVAFLHVAGNRNEMNLLCGFHWTRRRPPPTPPPPTPPQKLWLWSKANCCGAPEYSQSQSTHRNQSQAQFKQHGPHIPTVGGRPQQGQAGDTTLAASSRQIYQHFYKTANTDLWCLGFLSSAWSLRLTVDIPGFVAGTATPTLLQRSVLRRGEEKKKELWCEL